MTYEEMILNNKGLIHSLANKYNVLKMDKEDRYQECLTILWEKFNLYNEEYAISTFITMVCKNHIIQLNRKENTKTRSNIINGERIPNTTKFNLDLYIYNNKYTNYELEVIDKCLNELDNNKFKYYIVDILNGYTNQYVANKYKVSKQYINKIYRDFIKKCKNLIDFN